MMTNEQRAAWLEERKAYVTASEVAAVMGLNPHKGQADVYAEKIGKVQPPDLDNIPHVAAGRYLESGILLWASDRFGWNADLWADGLVPHPTCKALAATPDGIDRARNLLIEVKNVGADKHETDWARSATNAPAALLAHCSKKIQTSRLRAPLYYWVQLQAQMSCTNADGGWILVCFGGQGIVALRYDRDVKFEQRMLQTVTDFWEKVEDFRNHGKREYSYSVNDF